MFSKSTITIALFAFSSVLTASASPVSHRATAMERRDFNCNVEHVSCCDQLMDHKDAAAALGGLLALPEGLVGQVGLSCSALVISAGSKCKSTPVCCSQISQSGLVNAGCTPLSVA